MMHFWLTTYNITSKARQRFIPQYFVGDYIKKKNNNIYCAVLTHGVLDAKA